MIVIEVEAPTRAYIRDHRLVAPGSTVVAAVSGGADSLCLLHVLLALARELECRLHVAHQDHMLRAGASEDAAFVAAHAAALELPCTVGRRDVAALARSRRLSVETAARQARYGFLREVARDAEAAVIATGHTRDDQAETLLLHLTRGSGLNGLAGMRPAHNGIIRPLLEVSRSQTEAYCAALGLEPRLDESNASWRHARNRLRHDVLPRLSAAWPSATDNMARAARLLAADLTLIDRLAAAELERAAAFDATEPPSARIDLDGFGTCDAELRPHVVRALLRRLLGHLDGFEERHIAALVRALESPGPNTTMTLPRGLVLARRGAAATLGYPRAALPDLQTATLRVPGDVATLSGALRAECGTAPENLCATPPHVAWLDARAAGPTLTVRAWRAGDRVRPLGMAGTRKVQDVFTDRKVPRALRRRVPIVEGPHGIAWLAGVCVGEAYRAVPGAAAVRITWEPSSCAMEGW